MSYKALYRTYRPNDFEEMAGQKHIIQTLKNAIDKDRIAHAYLFSGPRGTGKTSSAKLFAKAINCKNEKNRPCGTCDSCIAAKDGTHQDIIEIDAASNNGVEEARSLIERVKYAPSPLGRYKIYIIDEVHMMSTGAFNALLKTIEEPPAHVIFILATTEPHKVIPTILSRCQRYDFTKISRKEIVERLKYVIKEEKIAVEDKVLENIALLADGGMRDALSILDQCRAYATEVITVKNINEIYGVMSSQELCELIHMISSKNIKELMEQCELIEKNGTDIKRLTNSFVEVLKESSIYEYTNNSTLLNLLDVEQVKKINENIDSQLKLKMIDILISTNEKYKHATSLISYLEIALLKMIQLFEQINISNIKYEKEEVVSKDIAIKDEVIKENKKDVSKINIQPIKDEVADKKVSEVNNYNTNIKKDEECINDEFILRLLVGANKPERATDNEKMSRLHEYSLDIQYARYANILKNSSIIASGNTYTLISVSSSIRANEINDLGKQDEFYEFTNDLFHKPKKVFAITMQDSDMYINLFKERYKANNLPNAIEFEIQLKKDEEQIDKIKRAFNDVIIMED